METLPITLIVKAPNQQIEDQTVKCELSWTINKLKQHLSEVYPSKPPQDEQRLIYSGQLLNDSVMLKDVLRQYDDQQIHTLHLVCTPKYYGNRSSVGRTGATTPSATPLASAPVPQEQQEEFLPTGQQVPSTVWQQQQTWMHLAWMHQLHLQYITQQMQLLNGAYSAGSRQDAGAPDTVDSPQLPQNYRPHERQENVRREEPNRPERDWLDGLFLIIRIFVLVSVLYFYSTPLRLAVVLIIAISMYLYQIGFFRNTAATLTPPASSENNSPNSAAANINTEENTEATTPSRLMIAWTFFATFFASLIPETPNGINN